MAERLPGGNEQYLQQFVKPVDVGPDAGAAADRGTHDPAGRAGRLAINDVSLPKDSRMPVTVAHQRCGALA